jgi:hypothetical protein
MDNGIVIALIASASSFLGGVVVYLSNKRRVKADVWKINSETIASLSERIDKLVNKDEQQESRIDELQAEIRILRRAYTYALQHIRKIDPNGDVPDFLMDTGDLIKYYKEHKK